MKFIVTNDDGFDAPGIEVLTRIVERLGSPVVVAPAHPQSGVGHQVTARTPIRIESLPHDRFRVYGTPADCTRLALTQFAPDADWVVAGINHGGNLGADVYTSGTVAAVREAALLGYRGIALSHYVAKNRSVDWDTAEQRVDGVLRMLLKSDLPPGSFWNVNLPHPAESRTEPDPVFCAVDTNPLGMRFERDGSQFTYAGDYHERPRQHGRDVDVCFGGKIAISRIPLDITP